MSVKEIKDSLSRLLEFKTASVLTVLAFVLLFITNGVPYIFADGYGSFHITQCLIHERSWVCNEKPEYYDVHRGHGVSFYEDKYISVYSPGGAIINLPGQIVAEILDGGKDTYNDNFSATIGHSIENGTGFLVTAMLLMLASLYLTYKALRNFGFKERLSTGAVLVGFLSSYAVWYIFLLSAYNHTPEIFAMSLMLFGLSLFPAKKKKGVVLAAVGVGIAGLARLPVVSIGVIPVIWLLREQDWRNLIRFIVTGVPFVLILISYNLASFGFPIVSSYELLWGQQFVWTSFNQLNVLVSPFRGWFVYSPLAIFSIAGFILYKQKTKLAALTGLFGIVFTVIIIGAWEYWWGGASFGQRFFISFLPFTILGLASIFMYIQESKMDVKFKKLLVVIAILALSWTLLLTALYRITPVSDLRPKSDSVGRMGSENRYTPVDMINYHIDLVTQADSFSDYGSSLIGSLTGGASYPVVWSGQSNIVLRSDTRGDNFVVRVLPQEGGVIPLPEKLTFIEFDKIEKVYILHELKVQKEVTELTFLFDEREVKGEGITEHSATELAEIPDQVDDKILFTKLPLPKWNRVMYFRNTDGIYFK